MAFYNGGTNGTGYHNLETAESYLLELSQDSGGYWHGKYSNGAIDIWTSDNSYYYEYPEDATKKNFYSSYGLISRGSSLLKTESSRATLETGVFTDVGVIKWRTYKGFDTIDPTAVSYSAQELYPGDPITITVTPRTPTYGGTVYYQYQYSTNGTTWTNIGSRTTATSATVTVPEGAEQFRARVLASDGWGFTSTTYVYGPNLDVSQMKAYATVQGAHRSISKAYAIIDGTVRSISKGYVTIDGKWKKLF